VKRSVEKRIKISASIEYQKLTPKYDSWSSMFGYSTNKQKMTIFYSDSRFDISSSFFPLCSSFVFTPHSSSSSFLVAHTSHIELKRRKKLFDFL